MPSRKHNNQDPEESSEALAQEEELSVVSDEDVSAEALAEEGEAKPRKGFGKSDSKLKEELKAANLEKQKYLEGWQRAQADLINYKRTAEKERREMTDRAVSTFIEELLPVLDAFDMAFANREAWESAPKNWRDGVTYIHRELMRTLAERDLTVIDPLGEPFDPHEHEAIAHVPVPEKEKDGRIVAVSQKGYRLKDKIIRPARVSVADYQPEA
jgi:molecular chaperone GrpE